MISEISEFLTRAGLSVRGLSVLSDAPHFDGLCQDLVIFRSPVTPRLLVIYYHVLQTHFQLVGQNPLLCFVPADRRYVVGSRGAAMRGSRVELYAP